MLRSLVIYTFLFYSAHCANILAIIPSAVYSHQVVYQPLWRELSLRGHKVTVMTTDPQRDSRLINLTEIDMSYTYGIYRKHKLMNTLVDDSKGYLVKARTIIKAVTDAQETQLSSKEVQELIHGEKAFDLVMVEAQLPAMMAFAWRFKCPMIGIASLDAAMQYHDAMGNAVHPIINPDANFPVEDYEHMTFKERLASCIYLVVYKTLIYMKTLEEHHAQVARFFGDELPRFWDLQKNMSMLFLNVHPLLSPMRPVNPNTINLAGMHLKGSKPLPKELKKYLDEAEEGVIYFSLGSNIRASFLNNTINVQTVLDAFDELPYKILWKLDGTLPDIPENVRLEKWVPQLDVLRHPHVKAFVMQGGLQSVQEAIVSHVPMIGLPVFGDQMNNINMLVKRGCGIKLDRKRMDKESFKDSLTELIENPKYRQNIEKLAEIFIDEPMPSLETAVYWTEYVIRHKGAPHLRSKAPRLPFWIYYMLDVIGLIVAIVLLIVVMITLFIRFSLRLIKRCRTRLRKIKSE